VIAAIRELAALPAAPRRVEAARALAMIERGPHEGPRGLTPWRVAESIAAEGTLDLARVAASLAPPHEGPWYEAAEIAPPAHPPEALAVPVALWCAGRRPGDSPYTVAAAASLARLTHREGAAVAGAIVAALAAQHALEESDARALRPHVAEWVEQARAWSGAAPPSSVVDTVLAAAAHPGDRESAARSAQIAGGLPPLARALAGGPPPPAAPADRLQRIARLLGAVAV
jgi:hypothetical protein